MADNLSLLGGRMPTQQQGPQLSTVLQGLQSAYAGQGPQFLQQMQQQEQYGRQKAMQDMQLQEVLAKSAAQDSVRMLNSISSGNVGQAIDLLQDRIGIESRLGMPSTASQNLLSALRSGDTASVIPQLQSTISSGVSLGLITGAAPKYVTNIDGAPMFQTPSGQFVMGGVTEEGVAPTVAVTGFPSRSDRERREEWERAQAGFASTKKSLNTEARTLTQEYGKIDSLADQATNLNASPRARRQAAATLITIVARIASPGVVTDTEFRNFGGFTDTDTTIQSFIANAVANEEGMDSLLDFVTGTLGGKIDPELLTQLRGAIDPLSPDLLDENFANGVKAIAQGLAKGTASSILSSLADEKTSASAYNPPQSAMQSLYGKQLIYDRVGKLAYGDQFDSDAYFANPRQYIEAQIAASSPSGIVTPNDSAAISGQPIPYDMLPNEIKIIVTAADYAEMTNEEKSAFSGGAR